MLRFPVIAACLLITSPGGAASDAAKGRAIAADHCKRCHVVGDLNKFGGIGSTPSFQLIAGMEDGMERFQTFYARRPHPNFVRLPNLPRFSKAPPYAIPFTVTEASIENLMAFVKTLKVRDVNQVPVVGEFGRKRLLDQ